MKKSHLLFLLSRIALGALFTRFAIPFMGTPTMQNTSQVVDVVFIIDLMLAIKTLFMNHIFTDVLARDVGFERLDNLYGLSPDIINL